MEARTVMSATRSRRPDDHLVPSQSTARMGPWYRLMARTPCGRKDFLSMSTAPTALSLEPRQRKWAAAWLAMAAAWTASRLPTAEPLNSAACSSSCCSLALIPPLPPRLRAALMIHFMAWPSARRGPSG
eukprot:scaffold20950_cov151-Isochrysis_galbana.AAC.1